MNNTVAARKGLPCHHVRDPLAEGAAPPCYRSPTSSTPFTVTALRGPGESYSDLILRLSRDGPGEELPDTIGRFGAR